MRFTTKRITSNLGMKSPVLSRERTGERALGKLKNISTYYIVKYVLLYLLSGTLGIQMVCIYWSKDGIIQRFDIDYSTAIKGPTKN